VKKKFPKFKRPRRETIQWLDHYSVDAWQEYEDAVQHSGGEFCESTGYVIDEDKDMVKMALSIGVGPDGKIHAAAQSFYILKICIIKRRVK
jgi:hypothetical protein